jgi:pimeloyl-ACP methyl ester carboxylesterase
MSTAAALADLAPDAVDRLATTPAEDLHRAIADRVFPRLGPAGVPARGIHDAISGAVYAGLRAGTAGTGKLAGQALRVRDRRQAARPALPPAGGTGGRPAGPTPRAAIAQSALNAVIGDLLVERGNDLALPLALRHHGAVVPVQRDALAAAHPQATGDVVLFVHGLGETEHAWRLGGNPTYGERLAGRGWTGLELRYNTGLHVSDNGRDLAELLEVLVREWPVPMQRLALVGHSMGGLVARSAGHQGEQAGHGWTSRVSHVICLGTPHLGAPLEQAVHVAGHALAALPEARPFATILRTRSAGIKDLRHGGLAEQDWRDRDPDAFRAGPRAVVPPLPRAKHCVVAATIGQAAEGVVAKVAGDGLVGHPSATATGLLELEADCVLHLPRVNHIALLNHPQVHAALDRWID